MFLPVLVGLLGAGSVVASQYAQVHSPDYSRKVCVVAAGGTNTTDDAPAILKAFQDCGKGGTVLFEDTTYYVNSVLNVSGLQDCYIDLRGTLVVSPLSLYAVPADS